MDYKLMLLAFLMMALLNSIIECKYIPPNQYQDSDVEFVTPGSNGGGGSGFAGGIPGFGGNGGPRGPGDVFRDWMSFIQGFFKEGNWGQGGPNDLAGFIGNQITRLVKMLTRDDTQGYKK